MVTIRGSNFNVPSRIRYGEFPWDSAIGATASLIGAGISARASKYGADKQLQAVRETNLLNQQLAREQNDWNRQLWEDTNSWNSTSEQLKRWTAAGLNPNSFASQASPVGADTMQSADLANQQAPDIGGYYSQMGNVWQNGINNAMSQILAFRKLQNETKKTEAETENLNANSTFVKEQVKTLLPQQVKESESRQKLNEKQVEAIEKGYAEMQARIENFNAQTNLADTNSNDIKVKQRFYRETWDDRKLTIQLANKLTRSQIGLNVQQANNLAEQLQGIIIENGIKGNEYLMTEVTNWITKVEGFSKFFETANAMERQNFFGMLFGAIGNTVQELGNGADAAAKQQAERNDWRGAMLREYQNFGSHSNALPTR